MGEFQYERISRELRQDIVGGLYRPGDRIPSEDELARRYGVSRMTARSAVSELVHEGVVYRMQGKGAFVAQSKIIRDVNSLAGFFQDMRERGLDPGSKVLRVETRRASQRELEQLGLSGAAEESVREVERIRFVSGEAVGYQRLVVPLHRVPEIASLDFRRQSFYAHLKEVGLPLRHAWQRMEAVIDPQIAALLSSPSQVPFFFIERVSYAADDQPVELLSSYFRADRYSYEVRIG